MYKAGDAALCQDQGQVENNSYYDWYGVDTNFGCYKMTPEGYPIHKAGDGPFAIRNGDEL